MPEAYESSLADLYAASQLRIPLYQRSYAWEPQQVNDLLGDIDYINQRLDETDETNVYHYFGTVVLDNRGSLSAPGTADWEQYDIIDGQQRLTTISVLMGVIVEELNRLQDAFDTADIGTEQLPSEIIDAPGAKATKERRRYVKKGSGENGRHLKPAQLTENAYERLVVDNQDPEDVLQSEDLVPAQKLANAKRTIQKWITNKRETYIDTAELTDADSDDLIAYYAALYRIIRIISSKFKLTIHEVPSADEAGRLFEAVNDRGRDITLTDKVRSYLIYVAGEFDSLDTTQVARKFNEAVETVALKADDDDIVDQFVRFHWEIFTGEHNDIRKDRIPSEIHRRIKHSDRHASMDRPPEDVVAWTNTYVDSLQESANAFVEAKYLDVFTDRYDTVDDETISRLVSLHNYNFSDLTPLMMALLITSNPGDDEFVQVVEQLEVYSFRVYQVMKRSTRIGRREFKEAAHRLYAAGHEDDYVNDLLGGPIKKQPYDSVEDAIPKVATYIDSYIGKHCPDNEFIDHLTRSDVRSGSNTRGWPGFCNSSAIRYLLYEYEHHLRLEHGSDTATNQLTDVRSLDDESTLEHIAPQRPESDEASLENHEDNLDRLGNLALLGPDDNSTADNDDYGTKYEDVYNDAQMHMLDDLPAASDGWTVAHVNAREQDLVSFCLDRWSGETTATVTLQNENSDKAETAATDPTSDISLQIRHDVVQAANSNGNQVPAQTQIVVHDEDLEDDGEHVSQCCGSILTQLTERKDTSQEYACVCGTALSVPNYSVTIQPQRGSE